MDEGAVAREQFDGVHGCLRDPELPKSGERRVLGWRLGCRFSCIFIPPSKLSAQIGGSPVRDKSRLRQGCLGWQSEWDAYRPKTELTDEQKAAYIATLSSERDNYQAKRQVLKAAHEKVLDRKDRAETNLKDIEVDLTSLIAKAVEDHASGASVDAVVDVIERRKARCQAEIQGCERIAQALDSAISPVTIGLRGAVDQLQGLES